MPSAGMAAIMCGPVISMISSICEAQLPARSSFGPADAAKLVFVCFDAETANIYTKVLLHYNSFEAVARRELARDFQQPVTFFLYGSLCSERLTTFVLSLRPVDYAHLRLEDPVNPTLEQVAFR